MNIYIGADHRGFHFKEKIEKFLLSKKMTVVDEGPESLHPDDDFTVFAARVVNAMKTDSAGQDPRGIIICGSGQGMVMAANRFKGIRAGLGWSVAAARSIRNDEDSNVLALPAELLEGDESLWESIVLAWLNTPFAGSDRYKRRIRQLDDLSQ